MKALVGGLLFEEWPDDLRKAYVIEPRGLSGWVGDVSPRHEGGDRATAHGEFDAPVYLSGRLVTVKGHAIAPTESELDQMGEKLAGLLADGSSARMSVTDNQGKTTKTRVRLGAPTKFTPHGDGAHTASFQITLWSADPRRIGDRRVYSGAGSVVPWQRGNFPAQVICGVSGSRPDGYELTYRGARFVVREPLVSGSPHEIDMSTGWLRIGGDLVPGAVSRAELFTIPPGVSTAALEIDGGQSLTATLHDTFI